MSKRSAYRPAGPADVMASSSAYDARDAASGLEHMRAALNRRGRRRRGPEFRYPWRTITAAALLLLTGVVMLCVGLSVFYSGDRDAGTTMLAISGITIVPGTYASFMLYGAWSEWPGYDWDALPSYDED